MKGWRTVNLKRNMNKDYPTIVCLDCLNEAYLDSKKYEDRSINWNTYYTSYDDVCQVCGLTKECTEPRDAGYPTFDYVYSRLRAKKINKILKK